MHRSTALPVAPKDGSSPEESARSTISTQQMIFSPKTRQQRHANHLIKKIQTTNRNTRPRNQLEQIQRPNSV